MRTLVPVHVTLALAGSDHKANEDVNNNEEEHWMRSLSQVPCSCRYQLGEQSPVPSNTTQLELYTGLRDIDISQIPKKATSRAFSFSLFEAILLTKP